MEIDHPQMRVNCQLYPSEIESFWLGSDSARRKRDRSTEAMFCVPKNRRTVPRAED
jgi:hypothetical protein